MNLNSGSDFSTVIHTPKWVTWLLAGYPYLFSCLFFFFLMVHGDSSIFGSGVLLGLWRGFTRKKEQLFMEHFLRPAIWSHYSKVAEQVSDCTPAVTEAPTLQLCRARVQDCCCAVCPLQLLSIAYFLKSRRVSSILNLLS